LTTKTKNSLYRIAGYAMVAYIVWFVGIIIVLETKSIYREIDAHQADYRTYEAERLVAHVDASLVLCANLGFIPYPLNALLQVEAYDLVHPKR